MGAKACRSKTIGDKLNHWATIDMVCMLQCIIVCLHATFKIKYFEIQIKTLFNHHFVSVVTVYCKQLIVSNTRNEVLAYTINRGAFPQSDQHFCSLAISIA